MCPTEYEDLILRGKVAETNTPGLLWNHRRLVSRTTPFAMLPAMPHHDAKMRLFEGKPQISCAQFPAFNACGS